MAMATMMMMMMMIVVVVVVVVVMMRMVIWVDEIHAPCPGKFIAWSVLHTRKAVMMHLLGKNVRKARPFEETTHQFSWRGDSDRRASESSHLWAFHEQPLFRSHGLV